jgi:hypothetical protein
VCRDGAHTHTQAAQREDMITGRKLVASFRLWPSLSPARAAAVECAFSPLAARTGEHVARMVKAKWRTRLGRSGLR